MSTSELRTFRRVRLREADRGSLNRFFDDSGGVVLEGRPSEVRLICFGMSHKERIEPLFGQSVLIGFISWIFVSIWRLPQMLKLLFAAAPIKEVLRFHHFQYGQIGFFKKVSGDRWEIVLYDPKRCSKTKAASLAFSQGD